MIKVIEEKKLYVNLDSSASKFVSIIACNLYTDGVDYYIRLGFNNIFIENLLEIEYEMELYDINNALIQKVKSIQKVGIRSKFARDIFDDNKVSKNIEYVKITIKRIEFITCSYIDGNIDFLDTENVNSKKMAPGINEYNFSFKRESYVNLTFLILFFGLLVFRLCIFFAQIDLNSIFD